MPDLGQLGHAVRFDGTGGELSCLDDSALELGSSDFTLEVWVRPESVTGTAVLAQKWDETADARSWRLSLVDGVPTFDLSTDGTAGTVTTVAGTGALAVSEDGKEWAHVVVARSGGTVRLLVDGVELASIADPGEVFDSVTDFVVGEGLTVALDELRLSTIDRVVEDTVGKVVVDYVYNARNQLVTESSGASVKTYSYDPNGNVLSIVEDVMGIEIAREEMTYDELNRMLSHTGPDGSESFTYRGAEWHRASANGKSFLYDGDNVLADISGGVTDAFYVTPFLDQNLSLTKGGSTYYYSQDGLGSVRTLTDAAGALVNSYDYLPFGSPYSQGTNVKVEQRYTYTGRERNPESALMYYRYRQYDPRVGRFGARDPIGYRGGIGLYGYVDNRSVSHTDAMGLVAATGSITDSIFGVFGDVKRISLKCLCGELNVVAQLDGVRDRGFAGPDGLPGGTLTKSVKAVGAYMYFEFVPNHRCGKRGPCCCKNYGWKSFEDVDAYLDAPARSWDFFEDGWTWGYEYFSSLQPATSDPDGWYPNPNAAYGEGQGCTGGCGGKTWMVDVPQIYWCKWYSQSISVQGRSSVHCYKKPNPKDHEPYAEVRWIVNISQGWRGARVDLNLQAKCDTGWFTD